MDFLGGLREVWKKSNTESLGLALKSLFYRSTTDWERVHVLPEVHHRPSPPGMAQSKLRLNISNALNWHNSGYAALD